MKQIMLTSLLALTLLVTGCSGGADFDGRLKIMAGPYRFSIAGWEFRTLVIEPLNGWFSAGATRKVDETAMFNEYFNNITRCDEEDLRYFKKRQAELSPVVERIIGRQIRATLTDMGIFNPTARGRIGFPPVSFRLEELPMLLVVSPREKIESLREIVLNQELSVTTQESLEEDVDGLGVSSLVTELGGIATYPSLISSGADLSSTIYVAAHEWLHQYLAFTPLGFRYVLDETGLARNYDIAMMNETLADIAGKEIRDRVLEKYYPQFAEKPSQTESGQVSEFTLAMREIRQTVDVYLAQGKVGQAESYMEQRRQELAAQGYDIRKLNQAYFAFNGSYTDNPAFTNRIGLQLQQLRDKSASLKDFVNTAAGMSSPQELTSLTSR
jgi:hypothetical protein